MFKPLLSRIMTEAHARAKADMADQAKFPGLVHRRYSYFLGLQMRNGFDEARVAITGVAPAFMLPAQRWA